MHNFLKDNYLAALVVCTWVTRVAYVNSIIVIANYYRHRSTGRRRRHRDGDGFIINIVCVLLYGE